MAALIILGAIAVFGLVLAAGEALGLDVPWLFGQVD